MSAPKNSLLHLAVSGALTLLLVWAYFSEGGSRTHPGLASLDYALLGGFLALSLCGLFLRAARYKLLLGAMLTPETEPKPIQVLLVTAIRNACVDAVPARLGELSYVWALNRVGVRLSPGFSSLIITFLLDLFGLCALFAIAGLISLAVSPEASSQIFGSMNVLFLACFLFLILSGAFVFLILNLPIAVKAVAEWCLQNSHQTTLVSPLVLVKIHEVLSTFQSDLQQVQSRTRLVVLVALTLCLRIAKYLGMYLLLLSILAAWHLGPSHVPPILALVVLVIAEASASLPMSGILGFGAYELTWGFMFATLCPNYCQDLPATQIALYLHFITQVVGLSLGLIALILLNILSTSSTKKSSTKSAIKKS